MMEEEQAKVAEQVLLGMTCFDCQTYQQQCWSRHPVKGKELCWIPGHLLCPLFRLGAKTNNSLTTEFREALEEAINGRRRKQEVYR